ncbi:MAG: hypothetical protein ACR2NH_02285 [Solirubrobacteraceae bacterium]
MSPLAAIAPAGGAELSQIIIATAGAGVLTAALLILGIGHRSGRLGLLGAAARHASRVSGLPPWAALPSAVATVSLVTALFGMYWDVSLHIDNGRDPGPLANPSHYFILAGLFGIFAAGWLAIVLPVGRPGPAAVRIAGDWWAPASGVMMMACASFALIGFPLDDVSHRLFGQDVTLWGPTHLMLLGGAALSLVGQLGLLAEARLARRAGGEDDAMAPTSALAGRILTPARIRAARLIAACGGLLIGLTIFQGEFEFGVPQFRLLYAPVLLAVAASTALVTVRVLAGRGAALGAVAFFLVVKGIIAALVGPLFGETLPHFPLYVAEGVLVEGIALAMSPAPRPFRFAAVAGGAIGTLGVLAEYGWSHVWMPFAWPAHILPEAIALSVPVAIAGGVLGAFLASAIRLRPDVLTDRRVWAGCLASLTVIGATLGYLVRTTVPANAGATVTLDEVRPDPRREVVATVRFEPPSSVKDADWLNVTSWQGKDKLVLTQLREVAPGIYRSGPFPVHGSWKSTIRFHRGAEMATVPVFIEADPSIPAPAIAAPAQFRRNFIADKKFLQRERKDDVPGWLWTASGLAVLGFVVSLLALLGWGLVRLGRAAGAQAAAPEPGDRELAEVA